MPILDRPPILSRLGINGLRAVFSLTGLVWLNFAFVLAVWLLLYVGGDRWWLATLILFGPRWFCAIPLLGLVPAAAVWRRRQLWPLGVSAIIVVGPIMGFCLPWGRLAAPQGPTLRVLTCNVKGKSSDNVRLDALIRDVAPDIVALQGCWYGVSVAWPEGWHVCRHGEIVIASRFPLSPVQQLMDVRTKEDDASLLPSQRSRLDLLGCKVTTPQGEICFCAVHPESPRYGIKPMLSRSTLLNLFETSTLAAEIEYRWQTYAELSQKLHDGGDPQIIAGDLNLPCESALYRQFWAGYSNAFSRVGLGFGYSEWPRLPMPRFGVRIDHVLSRSNWRPTRCWVGPDVGSDHLPLIADLVFVHP